MKKNPKVSVVMATRNRAHLLERSINSILKQRKCNFELIIIDNDSEDNTKEIVKNLQRKDKRIRYYLYKKCLGPSNARNVGIKKARGKYIAIMDDDDISLPGRLYTQQKYLDEHPDVFMVCGAVKWVDKYGKKIGIFPGILQRNAWPETAEDVFKLLYLKSNKVPNTTIMVRKFWKNKFCLYPPEFSIGEDWFLFMKLSLEGAYIKGLSQIFVNQLRDSNESSLMQNKASAFKQNKEELKIINKLLKKKNPKLYKEYSKLAWSNLLTGKVRYLYAIGKRKRGILLTLNALLLSPHNESAYNALIELSKRLIKRWCRKWKEFIN